MFTFQFIVHSTLYFVPCPQCGTIKYKDSKKYKILCALTVVPIIWYRLGPSFILWPLIRAWAELILWLLPLVWAELHTLASDKSLGRVLCLIPWYRLLYFDLWYGPGPSFILYSLIWATHLWACLIFRFPHLQLPLKSLFFIEGKDLTETVEKYIVLI